MLAAGPLPVRLIAGHFPAISRPAVSKHLRILREGGLVSEQRSGRERYYSLDRGTVAETLDWMEGVYSKAARAVGTTKPAPRSPGTGVRTKASRAKAKRTSGSTAAARRAAGSTGPDAGAQVPPSLEPGPKAKSSKPVEPVLATDASADSNDWRSW
ncbi:MAG: helix-turn-helix transcriptional regulator [Acidobacteria bacterium]|nr:helix-turn-helix transcriptional regulator [Acidobacteriota bacterium]